MHTIRNRQVNTHITVHWYKNYDHKNKKVRPNDFNDMYIWASLLLLVKLQLQNNRLTFWHPNFTFKF